MRAYIYLHGFASSPNSAKARYLHDRFQSLGQPLLIPDLNQGDFYHLTLSRQLHQVTELIPKGDVPVTVIGSSFGGLTAAWVGERCPAVDRLVLLAPAFQFQTHLVSLVGAEKLHRWQMEGSLMAYHYSEQRSLPIHYGLMTDLAQYDESQLQRSIPTLILHGNQDDVIPLQSSRAYAASRPWVQLIELESDHTLANVLPLIWQDIQEFCGLEQEMNVS